MSGDLDSGSGMTRPPAGEARAFYEKDAERRDHWTASGREAFVQLDNLRYERIVAGIGRGHAVAVDLGCGSGVLASRLAPVAGMVVVSVPYREEREEQVCPNCHGRFPLRGHLHSFDETTLAEALRRAGFEPLGHAHLNSAVATRLGRVLPHMNRHLIVFARKPRDGVRP